MMEVFYILNGVPSSFGSMLSQLDIWGPLILDLVESRAKSCWPITLIGHVPIGNSQRSRRFPGRNQESWGVQGEFISKVPIGKARLSAT
jgi:hypothetical protein